MEFNVVTIRDMHEPDDALFPRVDPDNAPSLVATQDEDGAPARFVASGITVQALMQGGQRTLFSLSNVTIGAVVTDSRLAFGCGRYDKGGGWVGFGAGAVFALVANGVSKALAAQRRRGNALVGQIRYPWLVQVGGRTQQGWLDSEAVRVMLRRSPADGGELLAVTLTVDKSIDSQAIAHQIAQRAARWRLANDVVEPEEERALQAMASGPTPRQQAQGSAVYDFPSSYPASPATAAPRRARPASGSAVGQPESGSEDRR